MAKDSAELYVAGDGSVWTAPRDTTNPKKAVVPAAWTEHGYTTEDGVAFSFGKETDNIMVWQSFDPARTVVTSAPKTITFALKQGNTENLLLAMGGGSVDATGSYKPPPSSFIDIRALLVEGIDGDDSLRVYFPRVMLSAAVEFSFVRSNSADFPLTFAVQAATIPFEIQCPDSWLDEASSGESNGESNESLASSAA